MLKEDVTETWIKVLASVDQNVFAKTIQLLYNAAEPDDLGTRAQECHNLHTWIPLVKISQPPSAQQLPVQNGTLSGE